MIALVLLSSWWRYRLTVSPPSDARPGPTRRPHAPDDDRLRLGGDAGIISQEQADRMVTLVVPSPPRSRARPPPRPSPRPISRARSTRPPRCSATSAPSWPWPASPPSSPSSGTTSPRGRAWRCWAPLRWPSSSPVPRRCTGEEVDDAAMRLRSFLMLLRPPPRPGSPDSCRPTCSTGRRSRPCGWSAAPSPSSPPCSGRDGTPARPGAFTTSAASSPSSPPPSASSPSRCRRHRAVAAGRRLAGRRLARPAAPAGGRPGAARR